MARTGRPTVFDREEALEAAMHLFWARGYDGATLEELLRVMGGITPPSLYHAFGSKQELYKLAVDRYAEKIGGPQLEALEKAPTAREGVEAMLLATVATFSGPGRGRGCLLVSSAARCAKGGEGAQDYAHQMRLKAPDAFLKRLKRGVREGDIARGVDVAAMAAFYATILHGMAVRAGDGVARKDLRAAVDGAMAAWDGFARS